MNIQILSDLHLEFHRDAGKAFIESLDPTGVDVLIVAGDLTVARHLQKTLALFCSRYRHVVYVIGNHELYDSSPAEVDAIRKSTFTMANTWEPGVTSQPHAIQNLHWLDNSLVVIDGVRFLGTTLWFAETEESKRYQHTLNDFAAIEDFVPWVYEQNAKAQEFLATHMRKDDVVVTHHLPSQKSVHPRYTGSPLNAFFVCDVESIIVEKKPQLWFHGHTHGSCDYQIGPTRVVCNPYGYHGHEVNPAFNEKLYAYPVDTQ